MTGFLNVFTDPMDSKTRQLLRNACHDSSSFDRIEELLFGTNPSAWFAQIDDSSFSLADWIEALLAFDSWLDEKDIAARPVESMIGYIHCCTLTMAETLSPPNLAELTCDMLNRYGFDAAQGATSES